MNTLIDLTGQRFGKLTVEQKLPPREDAKTWWLCRCDCGDTCVTTSYALRSGRQKSCGCARIKDLTGQRFGTLTVERRSERFVEYPSRGKRYLWQCRCDCGQTVYRLAEKLRAGRECACKECAGKAAARLMTASAGFVEGTQLSKIAVTKPNAGSRTGVRGVFFNNRTQKYRAMLRCQGKDHYLGEYVRLEDAVKARKEAEDRYFAPLLARYSE